MFYNEAFPSIVNSRKFIGGNVCKHHVSFKTIMKRIYTKLNVMATFYRIMKCVSESKIFFSILKKQQPTTPARNVVINYHVICVI